MPGRLVVRGRNHALRLLRAGAGWGTVLAVLYNQYRLGQRAVRNIEQELRPVTEALRRSGYQGRLQRNLNLPASDTAMFGSSKRSRQSTVEYKADPSGYQQISYSRYRDGKNRYSAAKIVRSNIRRQDYWFKGIKTFDDHGFYWMDKFLSGDLRYTSAFIFAPFHVAQVGNVPKPMRRIGMNGDLFFSSEVFGQLENGSLDSGLQGSTDFFGGPSSDAIGPHGYLAWTDLKLNLWGAKLKSTRFALWIIKPMVENANPFEYALNVNFPEVLQEQFKEVLRPITVNPISTSNNMTDGQWKVIKKYVWDIDPVLTQEGDPDPHVRQVSVFNRWDRSIDFNWTTKSAYTATAAEFNDPAQNRDETIFNVDNVRPEADKDVFFMLTATNYTPYAGEAGDNNVDPSFDFSFRSSWRKMLGN